MEWYYAEANERRGPVDEATFRNLIAAGTITPATLVWRDGMGEWTAFSKLPDAAPNAPAVASTATVGLDEEPCSECGRVFPTDEMITYEGRAICANCKPLFFQKIREGAATGVVEYASVWQRFAAKFVDGILLNIVSRLIGLAVIPAMNEVAWAVWIATAINLGLGAAYVIFFTGKYGATPGKMACRLQIIRASGAPITFGRATGRYFAEYLSAFTLSIGYLMACFDPERRTLHDRVCDTRVIKKS